MLVLSRRLYQSIFIKNKEGDVIEVIVTMIKDRSVRLGIKASDKYTIVRDDAHEKQDTTNKD